MRVLVTNDDGVAAPGLAVAEAIASEVAGPDGDVWVVAPAFEQSGVSHAISFTKPVQVQSLSQRRHACEGTPADCVIIALHALMVDGPPDLILSGVNRGHNIAEDAVYSGTVGGAIEGVLQGVKSIALSQYYRRASDGSAPDDPFESARAHGAAAVRLCLSQDWPERRFFNVNFPPVAAADTLEPRFARQGRRGRPTFMAEPRQSPGGRDYFWLRAVGPNPPVDPLGDNALAAAGHVTIVPMTPDYTDPSGLPPQA